MTHVPHAQDAAATASHLRLAVQNNWPVGRRKAKDLVRLRCVAGRAFLQATGMTQAADLTAQQIYYGMLDTADRTTLAAWPPFEKF